MSSVIDDLPGVKARARADGTISYQVTVCLRRDGLGRQERRYQTYTPPAGETKRETRKALERIRSELLGERINPNSRESGQTLAQFSQVFLEDKEAAGCTHHTLQNYRQCLKRINAALGNVPLNQLTTAQIDRFYRSLSKERKQGPGGAVALPALSKTLKARKLSRAELARRAGLGASTVNGAVQGRRVSMETAQRIAAALDRAPDRLFLLQTGGETISTETVLSHHRVLRDMLALAKRKKLVKYNEADDCTIPKREKKEAKTLQPEEIAVLLKVLEGEPLMWQAMLHLFLVTGARRGEIAGLLWENVDFSSCCITIDHALYYAPDKGLYTGSTKTRQTRYNRIPAQAAELLRRWKREQAAMAMASGDHWERSGYVFTGDTGGPLHPDSISSYVGRLAEKCDIPGLHTHTLRHTAASVLIASGIDVVTVAGQLGHADAATTTRIYAHAIERNKAAAADALGLAIYQTADKQASGGR